MQARARPVVAIAALAALLAVAAPSGAHPESAAPSLRPDVVRAGHDPEVVEPHTQWQGFLELREDTNVTAAYYQVCRVGQACFAPPTPADRLHRDLASTVTFRFDTSTYLANGQPVDYEPGWRIGVKWILEERADDGSTRVAYFPDGPEVESPACQGDAAMACAEAHYLAFDIRDGDRGSPSPSPLSVLLAISVAAVAASGVAARRGR